MNPIMTLASLDLIFEGLGIPIDIYIVIVISISGIILSAKSMKIGLAMLLLLYAITYTTFRAVGMDTTYALYAIFGCLILMALSIFTTKGGTIV
ncbi:MAG: hypothetical protein WC325_11035 [Candidatus Bathyarchaeia archaeon]|jgi:hypothetical protein